MWPFKQKAQPVKTGRREFKAAQISRLTASMPTLAQSMDWDLRLSLLIMRSRSRSLVANNDYAKKFLQMCSTHIVGPNGFNLQVRVTETDSKGKVLQDGLASAAIEAAFSDWSMKGNCDVTGRHSFFDCCNLIARSVARDGEALVRKIYGEGPYGFQLQVLDIDRLEINLNQDLGNGSIIKMGVEINQFGKPVAYHIRKRHPGDNPYYTVTGSVYDRVPAEDVYHLFVSDRPEQNRGIPWMHSAMIRLENLGGYEEAAIIAARVGAAKMGFYVSPDGDGTPLADDVDETGDLMTEADPGQFEVLPQGYDFKNFNPDYPHQMFADFVKAALRGVASGLGVAYNTISNDLEGVNFSSIRTGVLEERDNWMVIQKWMIENFLNDLFSTWLKFALLKKKITLPNGSALPASKFDKFNQATWLGRRWQWVNPVQDIEANVIAINNGLKSRESVISETGNDIDDVFTALADEQKKIADLGIKIEVKAAPAAVAAQDNSTLASP